MAEISNLQLASLLYQFSFGNGADGAKVFAANTSLVQDLYASSITVNAGVVLNPAGFNIFCNGTCTIAATGKIASNGGNGVAGSGTAAGGTGPVSGVGAAGGGRFYMLGGSQVGGDGGAGHSNITAGEPGVGMVFGTDGSIALGGSGGAGGAGSTAAGGAAGTTEGLAAAVARPDDLFSALTFGARSTPAVGIFPSAWCGGAGGGGGGGDATHRGGGGGAGAGCFGLFAFNLVLAGTLEATGGNGGAGDPAGNTGGGGAGAGGAILLVTHTKSGAGSLIVTAGTPGAKAGTGIIGGAGSAGNTFQFTI